MFVELQIAICNQFQYNVNFMSLSSTLSFSVLESYSGQHSRLRHLGVSWYSIDQMPDDLQHMIVLLTIKPLFKFRPYLEFTKILIHSEWIIPVRILYKGTIKWSSESLIETKRVFVTVLIFKIITTDGSLSR